MPPVPPTQVESGFSELMVYHEEEKDSVGTKAGGVLLNSLAMVAMLAVVTSLMLLMYKMRCYKLMYGWLLLSVLSLLFSFGGFVAERLLERARIRIEPGWGEATFYAALLVFAACGTAAG